MVFRNKHLFQRQAFNKDGQLKKINFMTKISKMLKEFIFW